MISNEFLKDLVSHRPVFKSGKPLSIVASGKTKLNGALLIDPVNTNHESVTSRKFA